MKKSITLDRNIIVEMGHMLPTITIKQFIDNKKLRGFEVYKCLRKKNKLFCYSYNYGRLKMEFKNNKYAIKYNNMIRELLKESLK